MGERGGRDGIIEVIEMGAESPEQVQTLVPALRGIGWQGEGLELGEAGATEELGAVGEALVQGEGVHAIFEHGLDPHQAEAMHQESAELPRGGVRDPDGREPIVAEEVEDVQGVAAVGLGLADDHGADLCRVPHEHGMTEPLQEGVEPDRVSGALNADRHGSWQGGIEVLDGRALRNPRRAVAPDRSHRRKTPAVPRRARA